MSDQSPILSTAGGGAVDSDAASRSQKPAARPEFLDYAQEQPGWLGLSDQTWLSIQIGIITVLFCALFWPNLRRLWDKTNPFYGEANWGHAICIPIIGLYYLYVNREKLEPVKTRRGPSAEKQSTWVAIFLCQAILFPLPLILEELPQAFAWIPSFLPGMRMETDPGVEPAQVLGIISLALLIRTLIVIIPLLALAIALPVYRRKDAWVKSMYDSSAQWFGGSMLLFGIALYQYGIWPGENDFVKDFGMIMTLYGIVTAMTNWTVIRVAWFPIFYLICGIPWPGLVYSRIASPLQQLAANIAVWTLSVTGVESWAGGTKIIISGNGGVDRTLNVAEACAGLRSLMTFVSVGAAVAFLSHRPLWQKIIVLVSAVPIAIFCNVMRVSGQGLLDHYVSQQLSENFAHQFVGLIMLVPAFLLILLVGWLLDQIFLEQVDRHVLSATPKLIRREDRLSLNHVPKVEEEKKEEKAVDDDADDAAPITAPVVIAAKATIAPKLPRIDASAVASAPASREPAQRKVLPPSVAFNKTAAASNGKFPATPPRPAAQTPPRATTPPRPTTMRPNQSPTGALTMTPPPPVRGGRIRPQRGAPSSTSAQPNNSNGKKPASPGNSANKLPPTAPKKEEGQ